MSCRDCLICLQEYICLCCPKESALDGEEVFCDSADKLSHVGKAAYEILRTRHSRYYQQLWNVTTGTIVGDLNYTPKRVFALTEDPRKGHDDWFPSKLFNLIIKTKKWCDITSLGEPDGLFLEKFKEALEVLVVQNRGREKDDRITIRMMFGDYGIGFRDCKAIIEDLTKDLPKEDSPINLWVGAWRKNVSWNHSKIIAVDGQLLHTGGHNLWDPHYLRVNPVCDISFELEGKVAHDGHHYANGEWEFVEEHHRLLDESVLKKLDLTKVYVSEYPKGIGRFPPRYVEQNMSSPVSSVVNAFPIISMGRYGSIVDVNRPSDDAFVHMIESAETIIHMVLQDLGPMCWPDTKKALPGTHWPTKYLEALARVIWEKEVDVEIILSNPRSRPDHLSPLKAVYGNGWTCSDVASEIIKHIKKQYPHAGGAALRKKVNENLRVCFIRMKRGKDYQDGMTIGLHAKHFIIDDVAAYIGSQNLYVCDLAEWGVLIDDADTVAKMMDQFWNPLWEVSYTGQDADVDEIMNGLHINRAGAHIDTADKETKRRMVEAMRPHLGKSHVNIPVDVGIVD